MTLRNTITHLRLRWRYRNAHTLTDLANLIADQRAAYMPCPDPDGQTMTDALTALGRVGFAVVNAEQGGAPIALPEGTLTRRAAVTAFASTEAKDWLDDVLCRVDWSYGFRVLELHNPDGWEPRVGALPVSRIDGRTNRSIGGQMDAGQVRRLFPVRAGVRDELHGGWLVTVFDNNWGRSDLFRFLLDAAEGRAAACR